MCSPLGNATERYKGYRIYCRFRGISRNIHLLDLSVVKINWNFLSVFFLRLVLGECVFSVNVRAAGVIMKFLSVA